jgi:hypothetical protein
MMISCWKVYKYEQKQSPASRFQLALHGHRDEELLKFFPCEPVQLCPTYANAALFSCRHPFHRTFAYQQSTEGAAVALDLEFNVCSPELALRKGKKHIVVRHRIIPPIIVSKLLGR